MLTDKKCTPCPPGTLPMGADQARKLPDEPMRGTTGVGSGMSRR